MKKREKTKQPQRIATERGKVRDWQPLGAAFRNVTNWALDIALRLSRDDPEEQQAIHNVRVFVRAWMLGQRSEVLVRDVLSAIAILFSAIEVDLGLEGVSLLGPLSTMSETPSSLPAMLRLPGAANDEEPTPRVHQFPPHRTKAAPLAA